MSNTVNIYVNKADIGLDLVDNTSDLNKPISTATQTALNGKEDKSNKSTDVNLGASDTLYPSQLAVKTYVDTHIVSVSDATASVKGVIKLTGDLGGTADSPTVPGLSSKQNALGFTPEDVANKSNDINLGNSTSLYPTQNAVKVYTDNLLGNANALVYKGTINASINPNYPAANAGELYIVSVAGKIGGASGIGVEAGDMLICNTDAVASGDQASVGTYWNAIQKNIDGSVTGPSSSANNKVAIFDGTTGKLLKQGVIYDNGSNVGIGIDSPTASLHINNITTNASFLVEDNTSPDASPFVIDNAGSVGIGTLTPSQKLEVVGNAGIVNFVGTDHVYQQFYPQGIIGGRFAYFGFASASTKDISLFNQTTDGRVSLGTNNTARLNIASNGNVGISILNPLAKLDIKGSAANNLGGMQLRATASSNIVASIYELDSESGTVDLFSGAVLKVKIHTNGDTFFNGGKVGVGTSTPTSKLHVVGDVNISTINNATTNTDNFLVSDSGVVKHRTASQLKSDLSLDQINNTSDANKPISSATQTALDNKSDKNLTLDRKTASYTLVSGDNNKLIEMNVASANNVTINNSVFTAGNQILVSQYGAGQVTFVAGSGVTLRSPSGKLKLTGQYSLATIIAISASEFYISGDLTA